MDKSGKKRNKNNQVRARVTISLPNKRIVISKEAEGMTESDNSAIALYHAFDVAERAVNEHIKKSRFFGFKIAAADGFAFQPTFETSHSSFTQLRTSTS